MQKLRTSTVQKLEVEINKIKKPLAVSFVFFTFIFAIAFAQIAKAEATSWMNTSSNMYSNVIGNVGIGTSNPGYKLTFGTAGAIVGLENSSSLLAKNSSGAYESFLWPREANNATYLQYGNGGMYLRNNSSQNTLYMSNQNTVGVGTNSPGYKLTVGGGSSIFGVDNTANFTAKNSNGSYETYFWPRENNNGMYLQAGSGGFYLRNNSEQNKFLLDQQNNICIGNC